MFDRERESVSALSAPARYPPSPMSTNRVAVVEHNLDDYLEGARGPAEHLRPTDPLRPGSALTARQAV